MEKQIKDQSPNQKRMSKMDKYMGDMKMIVEKSSSQKLIQSITKLKIEEMNKNIQEIQESIDSNSFRKPSIPTFRKK